MQISLATGSEVFDSGLTPRTPHVFTRVYLGERSHNNMELIALNTTQCIAHLPFHHKHTHTPYIISSGKDDNLQDCTHTHTHTLTPVLSTQQVRMAYVSPPPFKGPRHQLAEVCQRYAHQRCTHRPHTQTVGHNGSRCCGDAYVVVGHLTHAVAHGPEIRKYIRFRCISCRNMRCMCNGIMVLGVADQTTGSAS